MVLVSNSLRRSPFLSVINPLIRLIKFHLLRKILLTWFLKSSVCIFDAQFLHIQFGTRFRQQMICAFFKNHSCATCCFQRVLVEQLFSPRAAWFLLAFQRDCWHLDVEKESCLLWIWIPVSPRAPCNILHLSMLVCFFGKLDQLSFQKKKNARISLFRQHLCFYTILSLDLIFLCCDFASSIFSTFERWSTSRFDFSMHECEWEKMHWMGENSPLVLVETVVRPPVLRLICHLVQEQLRNHQLSIRNCSFSKVGP